MSTNLTNNSSAFVDQYGQVNTQLEKVHNLIDNYIYLYHTKTLIVIPTYPESLTDSQPAQFSETMPLSSTAPIYSYSNSGSRSLQISFQLHRDMMNQVNIESSNVQLPDLYREDYIDLMINQLQAIALPKYVDAEKMVNPPLVAVRFGNDIFCKGVVQGGVTITYSGPILTTNKYALINVSFNVHEIDPYDAQSIMTIGSFRSYDKNITSTWFRDTTITGV